MIDEKAIFYVKEAIMDALLDLDPLSYVETLTELRNRIDETINDYITN